MGKGKYSPVLPAMDDYSFNCYGQVPTTWNGKSSGVEYDQKTMYGNYDLEGFDSYGYSAFYADGSYAGVGQGVDRLGNTESDYLGMSEEEFAAVL